MKKLVYIYKFFSENSVKKLTRKFWLMVILSLSSTLIISVQPLLMAKVINVISLDDAAPFYVVMLLIISYVIIISIRRLVAAFNFLVLIEVRNEIVTYLSAIYLKNIFDNKSLKKKYENTGGLTQNLNQTTEEISVLLKNMVSNFIPPAFQLLFSIIAITFSGDILVASFFGLYFFIYIFVKRLYNPRIISLYEDFYATSVKRYSLLTDSIKNIEVARASGSFDYMFNRYRDHLNNIEVKHKELLRYDARFLAVEALLAILFFGVVFTITLFRVINRDVSVGHFVMISSYILLLSGPLETIGAMYTAVLKSTNSAYNFLASINQQIQPGKTGVVLPRSEMSITVDKVFFVYEGSHEWLFQGVEVKFNKCHFTTVTGISGSGKSTLAKLICKMLVPAQGRVLFNSTDIAGAGDDEFAQAIYYVNQEEFIFMATLRFNLRIANPVASDGDVINALNLAELNELIDGSELEDPLDLKIGDDGETLSGGQKQRLSLARLFLRNPKIIVLDEATSALDIITEKKVLMNIRTRFPAATIINISHRPSTFEFSDEIIIFESGTVVERGDLSYLQENSVAFKKILEANHSRCQ